MDIYRVRVTNKELRERLPEHVLEGHFTSQKAAEMYMEMTESLADNIDFGWQCDIVSAESEEELMKEYKNFLLEREAIAKRILNNKDNPSC